MCFVWTSWAILADIETDARNASAAAETRRQAIECYLAFRRDGGENHFPDVRICLAVTQPLRAGDTATAASLLQELAADPEPAWLRPFIQVLQAIVAGSRDRTLAALPWRRTPSGTFSTWSPSGTPRSASASWAYTRPGAGLRK